LTRPAVVEEPVFHINNGRHLLLELASTTAFVPNSTALGSDGSIHVITGPNFSGKSVYIKQVGLMAVMSQAGCFIPADAGSVLGLVDRVFTRIHSRETVALHQSSFSIDLHQMHSALHHCTKRSLLLIDEFGKGSNPFDGISLLAACIQHLQSKGAEGSGCCPRALITTHFSELQSHQLLQSQASIEFHQMQVELDETEGEDDIVFLFKLVPGFAHSSFGLNCARLAGITEQIIDRAKEVAEQLGQNGQEEGTQRKPLQPVTSEKAANLYSHVCGALAAFDTEKGDIHAFLRKIKVMQEAATLH
jgi:DNA mismatch repair protein MSH5